MNYKEFKVAKGADQLFTLLVTDNAETAIDLSVFEKIFIVLYYRDRSILQKFSVTTETGYNGAEIGGADNNELSFRLLTIDTNLAKEEIVLYEIRALKEDSGSTDDSIFDSIVTDQYLCTIVKSITSTITLP